jgi:hypothetical protein
METRKIEILKLALNMLGLLVPCLLTFLSVGLLKDWLRSSLKFEDLATDGAD